MDRDSFHHKNAKFRSECGSAKCFFCCSCNLNVLMFNKTFSFNVCLKGPHGQWILVHSYRVPIGHVAETRRHLKLSSMRANTERTIKRNVTVCTIDESTGRPRCSNLHCLADVTQWNMLRNIDLHVISLMTSAQLVVLSVTPAKQITSVCTHTFTDPAKQITSVCTHVQTGVMVTPLADNQIRIMHLSISKDSCWLATQYVPDCILIKLLPCQPIVVVTLLQWSPFHTTPQTVCVPCQQIVTVQTVNNLTGHRTEHNRNVSLSCVMHESVTLTNTSINQHTNQVTLNY